MCAVRCDVGYLLLRRDRHTCSLQCGQIRCIAAVYSGWSISHGFGQLNNHDDAVVMMMMMMSVMNVTNI